MIRPRKPLNKQVQIQLLMFKLSDYNITRGFFQKVKPFSYFV